MYKGVRYRSRFEASIAEQLHEAGVMFAYEDVELFYEIPSVYLTDFTVGTMIIEVKGYFSPADRRKMLAVKASHPDEDVRFVFQNVRQKLSRAPRSLTYAQWADRHGFKWAEDRLPAAWLREK